MQSRPRPDYDPEGLYIDDIFDAVGRSVGLVSRNTPRDPSGSGILVSPRIEFGSYYDSNVLRTATNRHGDFVQTTRASLDVASERDDHGIEFGGFGEVGYFSRFVSENYRQYGGYAGGFLVPTDETKIGVRVSQERLRQLREETGAGAIQLRPTVYHLTTASVTGSYTDADWLVVPTGRFQRYVYDPNPPVVLGSEFDHNTSLGSLRIGHSVSEGSAIFVEPSVNARTYDQSVGPDGFQHDSSGYQILAGVRLDLSSVTYIEAAVGWLEQRYVDPAFQPVSGQTFAATAVWNPRDWITASLEGARRVDEVQLPGFASAVVTFATGSFDYELLDNWLANANLGYAQSQFEGTGGTVPRIDTSWRYGLGTRYLVDRGFTLGAAWTMYDRSSTVPSAAL